MSRQLQRRQEYIDVLRTVLSVRQDVKDLVYRKHPSSQAEYMFMTMVTGEVFMFDISGMREDQIYHCMAELECGNAPKNLISDRDKRLELGLMFY